MEIVIDENSAGQRFDRFLRKYCKPYPDVKLSDIFSWLRKGAVRVINNEEWIVNNNEEWQNVARKKKENYRLQVGDIVVFSDKMDLGDKSPILLVINKEDRLEKLSQEKIKEMIVLENENWLVFDKPAWVVMHSNNKHKNDLTMQDFLDKKGSIYEKSVDNSTFKPSFCFRLDKDTSGILIAWKTYDSLKYLNKIIRDREVEKYYLAVVGWEFSDYVKIDKSLEKWYNSKFDRSQTVVSRSGKKSLSEVWKIQTVEHNLLWKISLVKVKIYTWRMHQIRVHLQSEGFPVLGDIIYGNPALNRILYKNLKINRQLLHCWVYSFWDVFDHNKKILKAWIPKDFEKLGFAKNKIVLWNKNI